MLTFLDLGEEREAQRGEGAGLRSHSKESMASGASFLRARWAGPRVQEGRGPGTEGGLGIPPATQLATTRKRGPERDSVQRHTQRDWRDSRNAKRRPRRRNQTKDARRRGERSRAAGAGVEPGWG